MCVDSHKVDCGGASPSTGTNQMECMSCLKDTIECPMHGMKCIDCATEAVQRWVDEVKNLTKKQKKALKK